MGMKTIDLNFKEWFDKVNGNSYCAGEVVIDYGLDTEYTLKCPFEYGYGEYYKQKAIQALIKDEWLSSEWKNKPLWQLKEELGVIVRTNIERGCLKRELKQFDND